MTTPIDMELIKTALYELSDVLDYIASERGEDDQIYLCLSKVEEKLTTVVRKCYENKN